MTPLRHSPSNQGALWGTLLFLFVMAALMVTLGGCGDSSVPHATDLAAEDGEHVHIQYQERPTLRHVPIASVADTLESQGLPTPLADQMGERAQAMSAAYRKAQQDKSHQAQLRVGEEQLVWMARAMATETSRAREMLYVGSTILNRVRSDRFPDTIKGVVSEPYAFEGVTKNVRNIRSRGLDDYGQGLTWNMALRMAHATLTMSERLRPLKSVTHFYSPHAVQEIPAWARGRTPDYEIGERFHFHNLADTR